MTHWKLIYSFTLIVFSLSFNPLYAETRGTQKCRVSVEVFPALRLATRDEVQICTSDLSPLIRANKTARDAGAWVHTRLDLYRSTDLLTPLDVGPLDLTFQVGRGACNTFTARELSQYIDPDESVVMVVTSIQETSSPATPHSSAQAGLRSDGELVQATLLLPAVSKLREAQRRNSCGG